MAGPSFYKAGRPESNGKRHNPLCFRHNKHSAKRVIVYYPQKPEVLHLGKCYIRLFERPVEGQAIGKISADIIIKAATVPNDEDFDILDIDTWDNASENACKWNGEPVINDGTDKPVTEREMVSYFLKIFQEYEKDHPALTKQAITNYISEFFTEKARNASKAFDTLDLDSWDSASPDKPLIWNGGTVPNAQHIPIKEREAVETFQSIFAFLERKGDKLSTEKKLAAINKMFKRAVTPVTAQKGIFDPRKTTSYQYADYSKPLVIDGVPIYEYRRDETGKYTRAAKDEGNFASNVEFSIEHAPSYQVKNGYQAYLDDYIQWEVDRCNEIQKRKCFWRIFVYRRHD